MRHFLPLNFAHAVREFSFQSVYVSGAVHGRDEEGSCHSHPPEFLFSVHCSKNQSDRSYLTSVTEGTWAYFNRTNLDYLLLQLKVL